jgi:2-polyprenyl-3-methyl-5-hydroxy-6-metoxy-1,4-benzoquinol methylase
MSHASRCVIGFAGFEQARDPIADQKHQIEYRRNDSDHPLDAAQHHYIGPWRGHQAPVYGPRLTLAPMLTDRDACPACGGRLERWRSVPAAEPGLSGSRYGLARCVACGSAVTLGEAPAEVHETGAYGPGAPRLSRPALPLLRAFDRQRLALLRPLGSPGATLLDVGAGRGRFVASARAAGYDARGIEPSERGASAARKLGVPIERVEIGQAQVAQDSVELVTVWHVLEHLEQPRAALERIATWVAPGGGLLVGVPNLASLQARLGGERWYHLDVPRHRVHFTPAGVEALLRATGFEPRGAHHVLAEHNPFGMWQSLVNRVTTHPSYLYNLLKRNAPLRSPDLALTTVALPLIPVAALLELGAGLAGRGGTVAVLARRLP